MERVLRRFTALTFSLSVSIQDFSVSDPLHVTMKVFIQLLTLSQLLELSTGPGLLSLFGKLSEWKERRGTAIIVSLLM